MKRRDFLSSTAGFGASLLTSGCAFAGSEKPAKAQSPKHPNVLFLAVDDLNDWVGCLGGHPDAKTPHIDRLASEGLLFEHAYCPAPLCNASRASLLTGLLPSTTGVYKNSQLWRKAQRLKEAVTLPRHFMNNGYYVAGGGKIFHGSQNDIDSWHTYFRQGSFPRPEKLPGSGIPGMGNLDWGPIQADEEEIRDTKVANWAASELQKKHDKPFFLACGIFRPHLRWYAPQKYFDAFPPDKITLPKINPKDLDDVPPIARRWANGAVNSKIMKHKKWREAVAAYLACCMYADACIGRVLAALEKSPYKDNTIVVFWTDHGWHLAEKLHWKKFTLWEEATRTPFIVKAPGVTQPAGRCSRPVSLVDIYPTLIELCGLKENPELDGKSLVPFLKNPEAASVRPALTTYQKGNHSLRSEKWRYTRYSDGTEELYDHEKDPLEWTNLAGDDRCDAVKKQLAEWLPKTDAPDAPSIPRKPKKAKKGT